MAGARLEIYDSTVTNIQDENDFGDVELGDSSAIYSIKIYNSGSDTATNIRLFVRCNNQLYTDQTNSNGQESVTEQWVIADTNDGSGFQLLGGDFGNQGSAGNYISLSNLSTGASSDRIDIKLTIPLAAETAGRFRVSFGVSYEGY